MEKGGKYPCEIALSMTVKEGLKMGTGTLSDDHL
jgi:hypothetical protein